MISLLALTGIIFGYLLAYIAPEELEDGHKYFILLKRILFITLTVLTLYYLLSISILFSITFALISIIFFFILIKTKKIRLEIITYIIFLTPTFLINNNSFILLTTILLFLYGFPIGTLIYHEKEKKRS